MCDVPGCQHTGDHAAFDTRVEDTIARHGWSNIGVLPEFGFPGYLYTVGLTAKGLPELIVDGNPRGVLNTILNQFARLQIQTPEVFFDGAQLSTDLDEYPLEVRVAGPTKADYRRASLARRLYSADHRVRVLHLTSATGRPLDQVPAGGGR